MSADYSNAHWSTGDGLPLNAVPQYQDQIGAGFSSSNDASGNTEVLDTISPFYHRTSDDPWTPLNTKGQSMTQSQQYPTSTQASGAIVAHLPLDAATSEPGHLSSSLSPIGNILPPIAGFFDDINNINSHRFSSNGRVTKHYRNSFSAESIRTEPSTSWITTTNTNTDALSDRDTILSASSIATYASTAGRSGGAGSLSWRCEQCDKSFTSRGGLAKHKKVGTHGQRTHKCSKCDASFDMSKDLQRHINTKHKTDQNNLFCHVSTCNRSFGKGKGFSRFDNLRQHCKMRHGEEELKNMPRGGIRVSPYHPGLSGQTGSDALLSWTNTGPGAQDHDQMESSALDMHLDDNDDDDDDDDYEYTKGNFENEDDEMEQDHPEVANGGLDAEGDIALDDNDIEVRTIRRKAGRSKNHQYASDRANMPPPPRPNKKSRSPEEVRRHNSSFLEPSHPSSSIVWPSIDDSQSGPIASILDVTDVQTTAGAPMSPKEAPIVVRASFSVSDKDFEAPIDSTRSETNNITYSSLTTSQHLSTVQLDDLASAKTAIESKLEKFKQESNTNALQETLEDLGKWIESLRLQYRDREQARSNREPRVHFQDGAQQSPPAVPSSSDQSTAAPLDLLLHPSTGFGHSRSSSMPNLTASSYPSMTVHVDNIFSSPDGSTSPIGSVRNLFTTVNGSVAQNEASGGSGTNHAPAQDMIDGDIGVPPLAAIDAMLMDNDLSTMIPGMGSTSGQLPAKRTCFCGKSFSKVSEFNKHYKRHWKRFQCPFPGCNLRFGTKDDWRRHDSRCHYQLGFWKCLFGGHPSCRAAYDLKTFEEHLDNIHLNRINNPPDAPEDPYVALQKAILSDPTRKGKFLKRCHNGQNNCEDNFWCGFCRRMIRIEDADFGLKAMNNRVDHIANHFANDAPAPGPDDGGVGSSTGGVSSSIVPPLAGMQGGPGGVGVPLPMPPLLPPGGVPLGARGEAEAPGPKWVHYDEWDMKDTERYIEDDVPQNDVNRLQPSGGKKVEQR